MPTDPAPRGFAARVLVAATVLSAAAFVPAYAAETGQELFAAQCADCHGDRDIAFWARQYPDEDDRRAWLDRFLQRHYPPPEEQRALIIDYIEEVVAGN